MPFSTVGNPSAAADVARQLAMRRAGLPLVAVVAAQLAGASGSAGLAGALAELENAGVAASVVDGTLRVQTPLEPEVAAALEHVFALALGRPDGRALVRAAHLAALGELTASATHEIANPLFAILALIELLLKDAAPRTRSHERLELIQQTALEIKEICRTLIAFAHEPAEERRPLDLRVALADAVELVRLTLATRDVVISERLGSTTVTVLASRDEIEQVVVDLVTNAKQAMPGGGTIIIELLHDSTSALVRVTDTGPGLDSDAAEHAFEPFFTTKPDGTGLGLAASRAIAELHGGRLDIEPAPTGASFLLRLPLAEGGVA